MWGKPAGAGAPRAGPHPAADRVARRRRRGRATRSRRPSTCTRRCATSSASRPSTARTATRSCPLLDGTATSSASGRSAACGAARCTSPTRTRTFAKAPVDGEPPAVDVLEPLVDDAGARASPAAPAAARRHGRGSTARPGTRRAGDPPAVRPERRTPVLGRGRFRGDLLYDRVEADADGAVRNLAGGPADKEMTELLVEALRVDRGPRRAARPPRPRLTARCTTCLLFAAAFLASAVEMVEALTIVLAVGVTRGWRSAGWGVAAALAGLAVIVAALGPALAQPPDRRAAPRRRHAAADLRAAVAAQGDPAGERAEGAARRGRDLRRRGRGAPRRTASGPATTGTRSRSRSRACSSKASRSRSSS